MIGIKINLQIKTVDQNTYSFRSNLSSVFQLIENYSHRKFFEIPRLDSQTFAIIVERDICRSTKVDVRNQEFDIDELASEKAVCTPWKLVEYEEIVQHLRAKTKIFEEQVQRNANR